MAFPLATLLCDCLVKLSRKKHATAPGSTATRILKRTYFDALVYHFFRSNPTRMIFIHKICFNYKNHRDKILHTRESRYCRCKAAILAEIQ